MEYAEAYLSEITTYFTSDSDVITGYTMVFDVPDHDWSSVTID